MGGEAVISGKRFNTTRAVVPPKPITAAPPPLSAAPITPPAAVTPPAQGFSQAQVEQMLAGQEDRFTQRLQGILASLQRPADKADFYATGFKPELDKDGAISFVKVEYERLQ